MGLCATTILRNSNGVNGINHLRACPRARWHLAKDVRLRADGMSWLKAAAELPVPVTTVVEARRYHIRVAQRAAVRGSVRLEGVHDPTMPHLWCQQPRSR
jgi:hypothetical protein